MSRPATSRPLIAMIVAALAVLSLVVLAAWFLRAEDEASPESGILVVPSPTATVAPLSPREAPPAVKFLRSLGNPDQPGWKAVAEIALPSGAIVGFERGQHVMPDLRLVEFSANVATFEWRGAQFSKEVDGETDARRKPVTIDPPFPLRKE